MPIPRDRSTAHVANWQTFFAMPIFDFGVDSRLPAVRGTFWLYWAITVPITFCVAGGYIAFQIITDMRRQLEDEKLDDKWK